eukprot:Gregarina_sp_Poly_1__10931@NODE_858_length_5948_cov_134_133141_g620_i0_p2_GENE_NODE_858_length_5948_cov_134_133141_g620_i0NODE_858_length_5948_cov_134_133141_g620_i0_p2_ORF_typecomplete_len397_score72_31M11L/PF11099_8/0_25M11L/PF11099_8/1_4e04_NODE_858_length_5948_cov_134_133141_g620_i09182108
MASKDGTGLEAAPTRFPARDKLIEYSRGCSKRQFRDRDGDDDFARENTRKRQRRSDESLSDSRLTGRGGYFRKTAYARDRNTRDYSETGTRNREYFSKYTEPRRREVKYRDSGERDTDNERKKYQSRLRINRSPDRNVEVEWPQRLKGKRATLPNDDKSSLSEESSSCCSCDCRYCERFRKIKARLERRLRKHEMKQLKSQEGSLDSDASGVEANRRGAIGDRYGKYGVIGDSERFLKRAEFQLWLAEVKKENYEELSQIKLRSLWSEFVEDFNTATFPSKRYYDLRAWESKNVSLQKKDATGPTFDDEEELRQVARQVREREKERLMDAAYHVLRNDSEIVQAMKRQKELKTRMDYLFKTGKVEQAREIQLLLRNTEGGDRDRKDKLEIPPLDED